MMPERSHVYDYVGLLYIFWTPAEAGSNTYQSFYKASACLNITRMLGVLREMVQDKEGMVECSKIGQWLQ